MSDDDRRRLDAWALLAAALVAGIVVSVSASSWGRWVGALVAVALAAAARAVYPRRRGRHRG